MKLFAAFSQVCKILKSQGRRCRDETIIRELSLAYPKIFQRYAKTLDRRLWPTPKALVYERRVLLWGKPRCPVCGTSTDGAFAKNWSIAEDWPRFCSVQCGNASPETMEKRRATSLSKYGTPYPNQNTAIRDKIIATSRMRWRDEEFAENVKRRRKKTSLERYGVDHPNRHPDAKEHLRLRHLSKEVTEKKKCTNRKRYGVDWVSQNEEIAAKSRRAARLAQAAYRERYLREFGVENPAQREEVRAKMKAAQNSASVRKKAKQTNIQRFGVPYPAMSEVVKKKAARTQMLRYGGHHTRCEDVKAKTRATNVERYGYSSATANPVVQEKMRTRSREKWGVDYPSQHPEIARRIRKGNYQKKTFRYRGRVYRNVMGAEPVAIRWLVDAGYRVIVNHDVTYEYRDGKHKRVYIPDIIATRGGIEYVVEVKSTYTLGVDHYGRLNNKKRFRNARDKARAVTDAGDFYVLLLVRNKQVLPIRCIPTRRAVRRRVRRACRE